jgi:accessory gene regulator B
MINQICESLTNKIRQEMPDIDDEEAEVIKYGLELIIGEVPKILLLFIIAIVLKIGWLVIFAYFTMLPYKIVAGGFHLKTNIGCTIGTLSIYYGNVLISKYIIWTPIYAKYTVIFMIFVFSMIMVSLYAPADTVNLPILTKRERKMKRILSYVFATITLLAAIIIKDNILSNILLLNVLIESICISKVAYKLTKNEYGYENYLKELKVR